MCVVSEESLLMRAKDKEFGRKMQPSWHNEEGLSGSSCHLEGLRDWSEGSEVIWAAGAEAAPAWAQLRLMASRPPQPSGERARVLGEGKGLVFVSHPKE